LQGGLGWYRKAFSLPEELRGAKKISIDFQGVYQNSIVYVNGQKVGNYPSGYTGFAYDITNYLKYGDEGPNVIVVKVQNMSPSGRWYTGSGIVRPVTLVVTNLTRIVRNGVVLSSPDLEGSYKTDGSAALNVRARVYSEDSNGIVALRTTVYDGDVAVASRTTEPLDINPNSQIDLTDTVTVPQVKLWSLENPFRYTVSTEVLFTKNGADVTAVSDKVTAKYGFRYYKIDNLEGLFINGQYVKMQGVDLHHDSGALGAAANYDAFKREMLILKSMGVNAYRTSHNPPAKEIIDVCSELGIVVMEEAYDGWGAAKATYDFGNFFLTPVPSDFPGQLGAPLPQNALWSDWVIKEMALRDVNEPSVIMWSVGNEMGGMGTRPAWYNWKDFLRDRDSKYELPNYADNAFNEYTESLRLRNDILDVYGSRYVVVGTDKLRGTGAGGEPGAGSAYAYLPYSLDGVGLNYNSAPSVDYLINKYKEHAFFFESESSSQTGARGVYQTPSLPNTPPNQTPGKRGTSSYDNNFSSWTMPNEYGLKKDRDRKAFLGQFIWSGFDYIGEPTPYGVFPVGVSSFGTIDTAGFPKDSYYLFKSQWDKTPMAHIVPMNWNDYRTGEIVEVWVNTNAVKAELFLNGKSLGVKSFDEKKTTYGLDYYETTEPTKDHGGTGYMANNTGDVNKGGYVSPNGSYGKLHLTWYVPYEAGELKAVAMDKNGNAVASDMIRTAGPAYTISLKADKTYLEPDGRSLLYVECDVVDKDGNRVPSAGDLLSFDTVNGVRIVGVDNGKQESAELYKWGNVEKNTHSERSAYNGKALVILQAEKGAVGGELKVSAANLVPAIMSVSTEGGKANAVSSPELGAFAVAEVKTVSVARGESAILPRDVKVTDSVSGVTLLKKVTWDAIDPAEFNRVGATLTVKGVFEDASIGAAPEIKVKVLPSTERKNIGLNTSAGNQDVVSANGPLATASFTSGSNYPNNMLNGNTTNYWDNYAQAGATVVLAAVAASRPYEFVETYWPSDQAFDQVSLFFTTNANYSLPKALNVQYWDGFEWIDATNQSVTWATASNGETKVEFDGVVASRVRVGMENGAPYSATEGRLRIVKFETWANVRAEKPSVSAWTEDGMVKGYFDNPSGDDAEGQLLIAVYDGKGRLVALEATPFNAPPGAGAFAEMDIEDRFEGCVYKVMAWDNAFIPFADAAGGEL
jgi:beta-galactosidase